MSKIVKSSVVKSSTPVVTRLLKPKYIWRVVSSVWQLLRQVLLLVPVKLWNCAMATNPFPG